MRYLLLLLLFVLPACAQDNPLFKEVCFSLPGDLSPERYELYRCLKNPLGECIFSEFPNQRFYFNPSEYISFLNNQVLYAAYIECDQYYYIFVDKKQIKEITK